MNLFLENYKNWNNEKITYLDFSRSLALNLPMLFSQPPMQIKQRVHMDEIVPPTRPSLGLHPNGISLTSANPMTTTYK